MSTNFLVTILFFLCCFTGVAQQVSFTGVVSDSLNMPLELATVVARPVSDTLAPDFAITDAKGRFKLNLRPLNDYTITASYIGYDNQDYHYKFHSGQQSYSFRLRSVTTSINEVIINYDERPILVKKDTITYNVSSFSSGNERKMKELLAKLPGVEVEKNGTVTVQGKRVTRMMVEGEPFFGGGSRLAVENIPADALEKIEVIDNFTEVGFMKQVSGSDELAMNVKLKDSKKSFLFGDAEAGAGPNRNYSTHAALFFYSKSKTFGLIADLNNTGRSSFSFEDIIRLSGSAGSGPGGYRQIANLYAFSRADNDAVEKKNAFAAGSFGIQVHKKLRLSGYQIVSKVFTSSLANTTVQYIEGSQDLFETRIFSGKNRSVLAAGNFRADYTPRNDEKYLYSLQYQHGLSRQPTNLTTIVGTDATFYDSSYEARTFDLTHVFEWNRSFTEQNKASFIITHSHTGNSPLFNWHAEDALLPGLLPVQEDAFYNIIQKKKTGKDFVDAHLRYYHIFNQKHHQYWNLGNTLLISKYNTESSQALSSGGINFFGEDSGFGNRLKTTFNDFFLGTEYKFRFRRFVSQFSLTSHFYHLTTNTEARKYYNTVLLQPKWAVEWEISKSESLDFKYSLDAKFPAVEQLAPGYVLNSYNLVYRGNPGLTYERYHAAGLAYKKMSAFRGLTINSSIDYSKKIRAIRNEATVGATTGEGSTVVSQFNMPFITSYPETSWNALASVQKKISGLSVKLRTRLTWLNYRQLINSNSIVTRRNSQELGLSIRTAEKDWPSAMIGYTKSFGSFKAITQSRYNTDNIEASVEYEIIKNLVAKGGYFYFRNESSYSPSRWYDSASLSLRYQLPKSRWSFQVSVDNLLNRTSITSTSFYDYTTATQTLFVLPRIALLMIQYKF